MTKPILKDIVKNKYFYLLLIPAIIYYIIFAYLPMYGITLAFKEFDYGRGILGSPWIGIENFKELFSDKDFWNAFKNTGIISFGRLLFEFPVPIVVALMLNEITRSKLKRIYQTIYTFPHFLSWVVLSGIVLNLLSNAGLVNQIIAAVGGQKIEFMTNPTIFRGLIFVIDSWKEMGYSSIIYMAAIAGINPELYEAAYVDGAGRFQQMLRITLPSIKGTIMILLILAVGNAMNGGFDQIFNLYNPVVYDVADIIDTYVYRSTFVSGSTFGYSTAVGLFKSIINFLLLYGANTMTKHLGEESFL